MTAPPARILLIGMMGSGKTTVGRALAERLEWPFLDNDGLVRGLTGREPAEIDATDGEDALHDAEVAALRAALARPGPAVIAVAGAVIDFPEERERLRTGGHVVWLRAEPIVLRERIGSGAGRRDDATDLEWLTARSLDREPAYRPVADQIIDVGVVPVAETVRRVVEAVTGPPRDAARSAG
jgi:shikimate kinase